MEKGGAATRGTIVLATVKGDVHDIGKNLVEIILSNNGYRVVNLGIKVPPEELIAAYHEHKPDAIGLSGLLVKSAQQMVVTAQDLKAPASRSRSSSAAPPSPGSSRRPGSPPSTRRSRSTPRTRWRASTSPTSSSRRRPGRARRARPREQAALVAAPGAGAGAGAGARDRAGGVPGVAVPVPARPRPPCPARRAARSHLPVPEPPDALRQAPRACADSSLACWPTATPRPASSTRSWKSSARTRPDAGFSALTASTAGSARPPRGHGCLFDPRRARGGASPSRGSRTASASACRLRAGRRGRLRRAFAVTCGGGVRERGSAWKDRASTCAPMPCRRWPSSARRPSPRCSTPAADPVGLSGSARAHHRREAQGPLSRDPRVVRLPGVPEARRPGRRSRLLEPETIGVTLTEGFMMDPEASVSALVFHHPAAKYFKAD